MWNLGGLGDGGTHEILSLAPCLREDGVVVLAASFSDGASHREGYYQRVHLVDAMLAGRFRVYVDSDVGRGGDGRKDAVRVLANGTVLVATAGLRARERAVMTLVRATRLTYLHSIFGAHTRLIRQVVSTPGVAHIWDVHGAVPEECAYRQKPVLAGKMASLEQDVARAATRIVTVSRAMAQHVAGKHDIPLDRFILLPPHAAAPAITPRPLSFVYSGSADAWQGFDAMAAAIAGSRLPARFTLLVPDEAGARKRLGTVASDSRVTLTSDTPDGTRRRLGAFAYGFCLREDHILNRVACPTKLIDYIAAGVVPILLSPRIGDFAALGLRAIALSDLVAGRLPDEPERLAMAQANLGVLDALRAQFEAGSRQLGVLMAEASQSPPVKALAV